MKEKNKNLTTNKILIHKLNLEGKSKDNNIDKVLSFKKPKPFTINPKLIKKNNNNHSENNKETNARNKAYNEALSIMHIFNRKINNNIKNYKKRKEDNNNFIKGYKEYKQINKNLYKKEIEQRNYIFGHLMNSYEKKGIKLPSNFFYNDIYKESSLLICKKHKMENFYRQDVVRTGEKTKKGAKNIKFLNKLSNTVDNAFKNRILNIKSKYHNNLNSSISSFNEDNTSLRQKMNRDDYFNFFEKMNSNNEKIAKEEKEIGRLKELISIEEKEHYLNKISNLTNTNNISNISNNCIENYSKNKRNNDNINDIFLNKSNMSINNSNSFNNNDLCTSSTLAPKNNSISNLERISEYKNKNNINNNSHLNLGRLSLNDSNNINIENYSNTKNILNNIKKDSNYKSNIIMESNNENVKSIKKNYSKRVSSFQFISLNKTKKIPPICLNRIKSRRRSYLPKSYFTTLNIDENHLSYDKFDKLNTNKKITLGKSFSQPNLMNKSLKIKEAYEKISLLRFHPFKRTKYGENINDLFKNYYGDNLIRSNNNNNNPQEILTNYFNARGNIMGSEHNYDIYSKYKELLPNIMVNKISRSKELNETIKQNPLNYAKAFFKKKYLECDNQNDNKEKF